MGRDGLLTGTTSRARSTRVRAHEYLADQLRREILLRVIRPGQSLPAERRLTEMFGVGRPTVQKAIALLVAEGIVEKRRGRSGGTFVLDTAADPVRMDLLLDRIRRSAAAIIDALDFRLELEPALVAAACARRSAADLAAIEQASRDLTASASESEMMKHDTGFHLALAAAAHNRFFAQAAEQIRMTLSDAIWALPGSDLWMERTRREHAAISRAVTLGDRGAGRRAALAHITHTDRGVRALLESLRT
jgi:GntR family transcriptional repressor for pyruvate dehydrogenase complex